MLPAVNVSDTLRDMYYSLSQTETGLTTEGGKPHDDWPGL